MKSPEERLVESGITLPSVRALTGNYITCVRTGNLIFTAAQGIDEYHGKLGKELTTEEGYLAAQHCMLNLLAVLKTELGDLNRVKKIAKILVMVNATEDFTEQPQVANGASDLLDKIFGEIGKHSRSAVGMAQLPSDNAVEINMVVEVEENE